MRIILSEKRFPLEKIGLGDIIPKGKNLSNKYGKRMKYEDIDSKRNHLYFYQPKSSKIICQNFSTKERLFEIELDPEEYKTIFQIVFSQDNLYVLYSRSRDCSFGDISIFNISYVDEMIDAIRREIEETDNDPDISKFLKNVKIQALGAVIDNLELDYRNYIKNLE